MPDQPYLLYGAYASYYTAKVRCYLRKRASPSQNGCRAIQPFVKWCVPRLAITAFPKSLHRMEKSFRTALQLSMRSRRCFPTYPLIRARRVNGSLFISWNSCSEGLITLAWKHRWLFEENIPFYHSRFWTNLPTARR